MVWTGDTTTSRPESYFCTPSRLLLAVRDTRRKGLGEGNARERNSCVTSTTVCNSYMHTTTTDATAATTNKNNNIDYSQIRSKHHTYDKAPYKPPPPITLPITFSFKAMQTTTTTTNNFTDYIFLKPCKPSPPRPRPPPITTPITIQKPTNHHHHHHHHHHQ